MTARQVKSLLAWLNSPTAEPGRRKASGQLTENASWTEVFLMTRDLLGFVFNFIAPIEPQRAAIGGILEFLPQSKYRNTRGLSLNRHGLGPFCQFCIPRTLPYKGVYALGLDEQVVYIGQCQNLSERFNERGYGTIHPRNCFEKGQPTNCKINHLILEAAKRGRRIDLWFHRTAEPDALESQLISALSPPWNAQRKRAPLGRLRIDSAAMADASNVSDASPAPAGLEGIVPIFKLTLEKSYYKQGFFNVTVDFDRFVRPTSGPVELLLGKSPLRIEGKVNRSANLNRTARVMGGAKLRDWFQTNHHPGDVVDVDLSSIDSIRIACGDDIGFHVVASPEKRRRP